jgi:hypothetical protein
VGPFRVASIVLGNVHFVESLVGQRLSKVLNDMYLKQYYPSVWQRTCQGPVPRVPRAAGYGPTNLDMTMFPLVAIGWGTKFPVPHMVPPLLVEGEGPPT